MTVAGIIILLSLPLDRLFLHRSSGERQSPDRSTIPSTSSSRSSALSFIITFYKKGNTESDAFLLGYNYTGTLIKKLRGMVSLLSKRLLPVRVH